MAAHIADARRWRNHYLNGLIRDDILEFGSIQSLAEDLHLAPNTVARYLDILEALFIIFRIGPHAESVARSLSGRQKWYFFDTGLVEADPGKQLENLVALCLRNKEGSPGPMVEVKSAYRVLSPALRYFRQRSGFAGVQLVGGEVPAYDQDGLSVRSLLPWLESLAI